MKISFIKYTKDSQNYKIAKKLGFDVFELEEPEQIDHKIEELRSKNYSTIIMPNELASFSEKIIQKYQYDPKIKIIITQSKENT